MMQDDNRKNCTIDKLPVSLYYVTFTHFSLFVKSECGQETSLSPNSFEADLQLSSFSLLFQNSDG